MLLGGLCCCLRVVEGEPGPEMLFVGDSDAVTEREY